MQRLLGQLRQTRQHRPVRSDASTTIGRSARAAANPTGRHR
ncbi:hypothetical protein [Streptomyces sp. NPDC059513]